jgi:hypothetical protein
MAADQAGWQDFDAGSADALEGRPERPTSLEYLRGYRTGKMFAEVMAEWRARQAPCVLPLESAEALFHELGPPGSLDIPAHGKKVRNA